MSFRETPQWLDTCTEVFPATAITLPGQETNISSLHVEGGIVEIADLHDFTPLEAKAVLLGSIGLSNQQIADSLFYSKRAIEWNQKSAFRKLNIPSNPGRTLGIQGTNELFTQRYVRVVAPIDLPSLSNRERTVFSAVANGMTLEETSGIMDDLTFYQATHALTNLRTKLEVNDTQRAILLGHMGHVLENPMTQTQSTAADDSHEAFTLHMSTEDGVVDYLQWEEGVVSFRLDSLLDGAEQQALLLSSVISSIGKAAVVSQYPAAEFRRKRISALKKLGARTVAHGLGQVARHGDLRVTRTIEDIELDKDEGSILDAMSSGLTQHESAGMLGMSVDAVRNNTYSMFAKMQVHTAGAAVLKGLMLEILHASTPTDTSAA